MTGPDRADLRQIFLDMYGEWSDKYEPQRFHDAVLSIGTHAPKLAQARSPMKAIFVPQKIGNMPHAVAGSGNGAYAKYMKVLLRPLAILGHAGESCLFEHLQNKGALTQDLLTSFESVFGLEAGKALVDGMVERLKSPVPTLHHENFPIFFIPGGDGGDLQASPAGSIEAITNMDALRFQMLTKAKQDRKDGLPAVYGEWSNLSFSDKPQNMIVGAPITRTRFRAAFPAVLNEVAAQIWKFKSGGSFPRFFECETIDSLIDYANEAVRLEDPKQFRGGRVMEAHQNRAEYIARRASEFIADIVLECGEDIDVSKVPKVVRVLFQSPIFRT